MKKPVIFGGDYVKRGLFWRRDMPIIIAGMFLLALATMDSIIRGPLNLIDKQLSESKNIAAPVDPRIEILWKERTWSHMAK